MFNCHYFNLFLILLIHTLSRQHNCQSQTLASQLPPKDCSKGEGEGYCESSEGRKMEKKCNLTPQSYEGPFFLPNQPIRTDIREGRPGVPLKIEFVVKDTSCNPIKDADVHLWHADAFGMYSAYSGYYPLGDPGAKQITGPHAEPTEEATFLRGIQPTDSEGKVQFITIYPGWYMFRALHTHFKITVKGEDKYTGEIYFPDELTDEISKVEPYKQHPGRRLMNQQDSQFVHDHGEYLVMTPKGNVVDGLDGSMEIIIE